MVPNRNADNKYKCYCSVCRVRYGGYNTVSAQTLKRHEKAEKIVEIMQNNICMQYNYIFIYFKNEIIEETFEVESNEDTIDYIFESNDNEVETPTLTRDLPLSESDAVFGIEGKEYTGRNDFDNEEYETNGEMSDDEESIAI
ncbi:hypothetical protein PHYBLDRAFT_72553 [Phycomyces blakesleeanus NRRL 1555(-)]|uniref:Uncharacterized protein n=1 Tax=Phycomyces blakesleeanus (strain ATCC 8743b / DSM 1359 / FGSC 10004 / NBRC 33097 / NRRL 1555) TaxID=763407 RepID=A0A167LSR5_PHYB8|nr:hypothetical protein PHYBLDRAFT_72553 [Phycomyces blakesleeanus NRRL 1555(-)]OAD71017.1 hypothetical protein PHYBLDRAFT_72553 [Phycomyces blakesleeanus NRRL 1555(-)]|eukprot:XP_018289057.1 hypothetical protein PHYBLDRAFT_72553 [Phycomyces blakesleeanus NRRL 1555(-)]